jgi:hypothetical protein
LTLLFVISFIKYFIGTDIKRKEVINIMWFYDPTLTRRFRDS